MPKIKIIAPKHLISALAILGIETHPAESEKEARKALEKTGSTKESALIFISEHLAAETQDSIDKLNQKPGMNVVAIPDNRGSIGHASSQIHNLVKNSIGAEVITHK